MQQPRVLDLFAGIGGFSLGLERAGFTTVAFCEIDPFCQRVLAKHWPDVPVFDDVRAMPAISADVVCGGPPCQQTSVAAAIQGRRTGETLWPAMARIVARSSPRWVIVEQPSGNAEWEGQVEGDLARLGYASSRLQRTASACGAPHQRRRVFIVANALRERCEAVARLSEPPAPAAQPWPAPPRGTWRTSGTGNRRVDDGFSNWVDRLRSLGNAVVPQIPELIGRAIMTATPESRHDAPAHEGEG